MLIDERVCDVEELVLEAEAATGGDLLHEELARLLEENTEAASRSEHRSESVSTRDDPTLRDLSLRIKQS